jgi:hypothetical protein
MANRIRAIEPQFARIVTGPKLVEGHNGRAVGPLWSKLPIAREQHLTYGRQLYKGLKQIMYRKYKLWSELKKC